MALYTLIAILNDEDCGSISRATTLKIIIGSFLSLFLSVFIQEILKAAYGDHFGNFTIHATLRVKEFNFISRENTIQFQNDIYSIAFIAYLCRSKLDRQMIIYEPSEN